jgi:hypothetical protein
MHTGGFTSQVHVRQICFVMLLFLLPTLGGCYFPGHPRYQPLALKNIWSFPPQGYKDIQLDELTYLVFYDGYHSLSHSADVEKWLQGAQEYALYRAGELARSKGANYFVVLYKDDWNLRGITRGGKYGPSIDYSPGAGLMIRMLSDDRASMHPNDDRVYKIDMLLQSLTEKNPGFAHYQNGTPPDKSENTEKRLSRWRSSISGYDSVPVPGQWLKSSFFRDGFKFKSGISTTRGPSGNLQVAGWVEHFRPTMPLSLLRDCVILADGMRFEVFKLVDWTVEEYRSGSNRYELKVWFRTTATVILQHQKEPDSLDPVFVVDEIRSRVMDYRW